MLHWIQHKNPLNIVFVLLNHCKFVNSFLSFLYRIIHVHPLTIQRVKDLVGKADSKQWTVKVGFKTKYTFELPHGKTYNLHRRKQRHRSAPLFSLHG